MKTLITAIHNFSVSMAFIGVLLVGGVLMTAISAYTLLRIAFERGNIIRQYPWRLFP